MLEPFIFIVFVTAVFAIFLARPFTTWWFHINDIVRLLKEILEELKRR